MTGAFLRRLREARALVPLVGRTERLTSKEVAWAYRILLDRWPENEAVVREQMAHCRTVTELRNSIMSSHEFAVKNGRFGYITTRTPVLTELADGVRLWVDLADHWVGVNVVRARFEREETEAALRLVEPGATVLDIGANIGYYTMLLANRVGPGGHVHAFEPGDDNFDLLRRSLAENRFEDRVSLHHCALSNQAGEQYIAIDLVGLNSGAHYLVQDRSTVQARHALQRVTLARLDDLPVHRPLDFVKIDVEGAERLCVEGGRRTLAEDRPTIMCEINPLMLGQVSSCTAADLIGELSALDYVAYRLDGGELVPDQARSDDREMRTLVFKPRRAGVAG
jgi:FkbM family methyltransferase